VVLIGRGLDFYSISSCVVDKMQRIFWKLKTKGRFDQGFQWFLIFKSAFYCSSDLSEGGTPVPIPNTEVKPLSADGTAWETGWESRTSLEL
jgi:hypothetical protein